MNYIDTNNSTLIVGILFFCISFFLFRKIINSNYISEYLITNYNLIIKNSTSNIIVFFISILNTYIFLILYKLYLIKCGSQNILKDPF